MEERKRIKKYSKKTELKIRKTMDKFCIYQAKMCWENYYYFSSVQMVA